MFFSLSLRTCSATSLRTCSAKARPSMRRALLAFILFLSGRCQGNFHQIGHRSDLQFFHDVGPVGLYSLDTDIQIPGDLFVEPAGDDTLEYLLLTRSQAAQDFIMLASL